MKKAFLLTGLILLIFCSAQAQISPAGVNTDSTRNDEPILVESEDNVRVQEIDTYADKFVPRRASLLAAVLPGAGQIYNKKYWKLPIVYGGFITLGYVASVYDNQYKEFRGELFQLLQDPDFTPPSGATEEQLRSAINSTRRDRDFYLILMGVFYMMQILDAHIDAHLKEFDLNPDLKVTIDPMFEQPVYARYNAGVSIKLKFK
ncbi:DUF5683 domain-containing protein [Fulvivirga sp.]|jgi:hypothetical protein|uniref:DUF5683 domain-containing protein n=1 Tax=Fulvivirga sp. TaxID=1931237 RepID=UPI0032EB268E